MWHRYGHIFFSTHSPVLLDIFLDAALRFDEGEGRFAITLGRHDDEKLFSLF